MRSLLQHGGKTKELAATGLINYDLLLIFVDGSDAHGALDYDVRATGCIADLVNALALGKILQLDLGGQDGKFIVIHASKNRDLFQHFGITVHCNLLILPDSVKRMRADGYFGWRGLGGIE